MSRVLKLGADQDTLGLWKSNKDSEPSKNDILRLRSETGWLTGDCINSYLALIRNRCLRAPACVEGSGGTRKVYVTNTYLWPKLGKNDVSTFSHPFPRKGREKWCPGIAEGMQDIVIVPVHHSENPRSKGYHWSTAVVNFREKRFETYDSSFIGISEKVIEVSHPI